MRPHTVSVAFHATITTATINVYSEGVFHECRGEFLEIQSLPVVFRHRYGAIPSRIYIRECYRSLYAIATDLMIQTQDDSPAILLTGVPGIGKSVFLIYFIFQFLQDSRFPDKRFVLEFVPGEYYYYEPTAIPGEFHCSKTTQDLCPLHEIPIFADISEKLQPRCRGKWLFIFSSPDPRRYHEIIKPKPKMTYTLPTWSYSELLFVEMEDENWVDRFILFGGVPRHVFWDGKGENPEKQLEAALESKGGIVADYFFKYGFGNVDPEKSHMLLHINPPWCPSINDWLYGEHVVHTFASDAIFKRITDKYSASLLSMPINLFNAGVASEVYGGGSAGNLFEKICLWLKPIAGQAIVVTTLSNPSTSYNIQLPQMGLLEYHWKENARDDVSQKLKANIFYQPKISNLESGDAFCMLCGSEPSTYVLVILQMTVRENHPVKLNGLHDIILAYPEDIQLRIEKKLLVFVTPSDGKLNTVQPYHTLQNKVAQLIPTLVKGFEQCVCRLSV